MQYHLTATGQSGMSYNSLLTPEQCQTHYISLKLRADKFGECSKTKDNVLLTLQKYKEDLT
jgi:hypothetical protein